MGSAKKVVKVFKAADYVLNPIRATIDATKNTVDIAKNLAQGDVKGAISEVRKGIVNSAGKAIPGVDHYAEKIRDNREANRAATKNAARLEREAQALETQGARQSVSRKENAAEVGDVLNAEAHRLSTSTILTEAGGVDPHLLNLHRGNKLG